MAGRIAAHREANFTPLFGAAARLVFPTKTAFELAAIGRTSDRAAKDWLNGKVAPPAFVAAIVFAEIMRRP